MRLVIPPLPLFVFVSCDDPCLVTQRLIFHPARRVSPLITANINKNKCMSPSSSRIYGFAYESTEETTSLIHPSVTGRVTGISSKPSMVKGEIVEV